MKIEVLLGIMRGNTDYCHLMASLEKGSAQALVIEDAKAYLLAALFKELKRPIMIVTSQPREARKLAEQ
ncbi:MAG: hypothetical protein FWC25_00095, partial [Dehalococcoidia bacterium]|nr:hypothetical protein [Dehalococcoidia bacterium]